MITNCQNSWIFTLSIHAKLYVYTTVRNNMNIWKKVRHKCMNRYEYVKHIWLYGHGQIIALFVVSIRYQVNDCWCKISLLYVYAKF